MGISIGQGFQSALGAGNASAKANNRISAENASAGNKVRDASNAATAAEGNLARFTQSVNNNRLLAQGGKAEEALTVNALRSNDAALSQNFSDSIKDAEQSGRMAASAATSGIGGSVVDMVDASTNLRNSIVSQQNADKADSQSWDVSQRAGNIMSQVVGGLDQSIILDRLDYNKQTAQVAPILGIFSRTLQGFFPAGTDALGAFRDSASSIGSSVSSAYNNYLDTKTGNATYNGNASPSSSFSYNYDNYDPNSTSMVNPDYDYSNNPAAPDLSSGATYDYDPYGDGGL